MLLSGLFHRLMLPVSLLVGSSIDYTKGVLRAHISFVYTVTAIPTPQELAIQPMRNFGSSATLDTLYDTYAVSGMCAGKISLAIIRASGVKLELVPSFDGQMDLEMSMATSGLPLSHDGSESAKMESFKDCAREPTRFTKLIGAHVVHAISRGQTPIIVLNGVNAFSTNWPRMKTYMELVCLAYRVVMIVVRLPKIAETERLRTLCPYNDESFSCEFYTASQIVGGRDTGVLAWQAEVAELQ